MDKLTVLYLTRPIRIAGGGFDYETYGESVPSNYELMEKLNEIVDWINRQEKGYAEAVEYYKSKMEENTKKEN